MKELSKAKNGNLRVADLALATTLSLWHPIEALERTPGLHRAYFCFVQGNDVDELVEQYWRREVRVEPQQYFNQIKALKARLYAD